MYEEPYTCYQVTKVGILKRDAEFMCLRVCLCVCTCVDSCTDSSSLPVLPVQTLCWDDGSCHRPGVPTISPSVRHSGERRWNSGKGSLCCCRVLENLMHRSTGGKCDSLDSSDARSGEFFVGKSETRTSFWQLRTRVFNFCPCKYEPAVEDLQEQSAEDLQPRLWGGHGRGGREPLNLVRLRCLLGLKVKKLTSSPSEGLTSMWPQLNFLWVVPSCWRYKTALESFMFWNMVADKSHQQSSLVKDYSKNTVSASRYFKK